MALANVRWHTKSLTCEKHAHAVRNRDREVVNESYDKVKMRTAASLMEVVVHSLASSLSSIVPTSASSWTLPRRPLCSYFFFLILRSPSYPRPPQSPRPHLSPPSLPPSIFSTSRVWLASGTGSPHSPLRLSIEKCSLDFLDFAYTY